MGKDLGLSLQITHCLDSNPILALTFLNKRLDGKNWELCVQSPEERKSAMAMSVDDYVKNGRHPMFGAVTTGELLTAQVEAKRFGYNNPQIEATLHLTNPDGGNISVPPSLTPQQG